MCMGEIDVGVTFGARACMGVALVTRACPHEVGVVTDKLLSCS